MGKSVIDRTVGEDHSNSRRFFLSFSLCGFELPFPTQGASKDLQFRMSSFQST